jgi:hypothetical protein
LSGCSCSDGCCPAIIPEEVLPSSFAAAKALLPSVAAPAIKAVLLIKSLLFIVLGIIHESKDTTLTRKSQINLSFLSFILTFAT